MIGGTADSVNALTSVERAHIATDGTLGAFTAVEGMTLAVGRFGHTSL